MPRLRAIQKPVTTADADLELYSGGTISVNTNHSTIDLGATFGVTVAPQVGCYITAIDSTTGDEGYTWTLHQSDDNFAADDDTIGTKTIQSAAAGDLAEVPSAVVCFTTDSITKRYIRLVITVAGTTPSVTYSSYLTAHGVD